MSQPQPFETQDVRDDDAQVLDSLFIETDAPPDLSTVNMPILVKQLKDPPRTTRMLSKELVVDPAWVNPVQLWVPDANRKYLIIRVESPTGVATDGIRISDDMGTVKTAGKVLAGKEIHLDPHNGPVYVWSARLLDDTVASAPVSISSWSVTE